MPFLCPGQVNVLLGLAVPAREVGWAEPGVRESLWALSEPRTATGAANLGDWGNWWGTGGPFEPAAATALLCLLAQTFLTFQLKNLAVLCLDLNYNSLAVTGEQR